MRSKIHRNSRKSVTKVVRHFRENFANFVQRKFRWEPYSMVPRYEWKESLTQTWNNVVNTKLPKEFTQVHFIVLNKRILVSIHSLYVYLFPLPRPPPPPVFMASLPIKPSSPPIRNLPTLSALLLPSHLIFPRGLYKDPEIDFNPGNIYFQYIRRKF